MNKVVQVIKPIRTTVSDDGSVIIKKKKVAAYARVSTDYEDQINSYNVQCEEYMNIITSNPDYEYAGVFADKGLSGTQTKRRPEFLKMIESAQNGDIDLIITKSISRFARNTVDIITTVRELRDIGVEIFFEKENISSLDPKIDFMLTILSSIAQEESRSISTNVKWAYEKKFRKGIVDARRIYGFDVVDGKYIVNDEEAKVVVRIFTLYLKQYKISDIVKKLNSEGIKNAAGNDWNYNGLRYLLKNEKYCGDALLRKTVTIDYLTKKTVDNDNVAEKYYVSNNHEPIITRETFEAVQNLLNDRARVSSQINKKTKYPLTGIIICPKCGRSLKRQQVNRKSNMRVIFNCNHSYGNDFICTSINPDYDIVLEATIDSIRELYANSNVLEGLFTVFDNNIALNNLREELKELKTINKQLIALHHDNPEDIDVFQKVVKSDEKIEEVERELSANVSSSVRLEYIKSLVEKEHTDPHSILIKDIYSLVIADAQKIIFVISPTKTRFDLFNSYKQIIQGEAIMKKMYFSKKLEKAIYYEVKLYA